MKKVIYFLILITLIVACQKRQYPVKNRYTPVNVGVTANDGSGDNLRAAFQKVNAGFVDLYDSLASAVDADDYYWELSDTAFTHKQVVSYDQLMAALAGIEVGTGTGTSTTNALQFIIGTTSGAPSDGDSTLYHTDLIDQDILLYRGTTSDMHRQYFNTTSRNGIPGYRVSNDTIIVRPAFATDDRVLVEARDMDYATFGTNSLLTGLMGYWQLEEASGSTASDAHSTNVDGTITATVSFHETGVINYAYDFDGTASNVSFGTNCRPTAALSISLWFNTADISTSQQLFGNLAYSAGGWCGYRVSIGSDGHINFVIGTGTGTILDKSTSTTGLDDGSWHHVACTWDGANAYVYVDNSKSAASVMSTAAAYIDDCVLRMGSNAGATSMFYGGLLDEVGIWSKALSDSEVTILYNETPYDFN